MRIRLEIERDGAPQTLDITKFPFVFGRDRGDYKLIDPKSSAQHAIIENNGKFFSIRDLGSTNGTFVNENRLTSDAVTLSVGQTLRLARSTLKVLEIEFTSSIPQDFASWLKEELQNLGEDSSSVKVTAIQQPLTLTCESGLMAGSQWDLSYCPRELTDQHDLDLFLIDESLQNFVYRFIPQDGKAILSAVHPAPPFVINGRPTLESEINAGDKIEIGWTELKVTTEA